MRLMRAIRRLFASHHAARSDFRGVTTIPFDAGLGEY